MRPYPLNLRFLILGEFGLVTDVITVKAGAVVSLGFRNLCTDSFVAEESSNKNTDKQVPFH